MLFQTNKTVNISSHYLPLDLIQENKNKTFETKVYDEAFHHETMMDNMFNDTLKRTYICYHLISFIL